MEGGAGRKAGKDESSVHKAVAENSDPTVRVGQWHRCRRWHREGLLCPFGPVPQPEEEEDHEFAKTRESQAQSATAEAAVKEPVREKVFVPARLSQAAVKGWITQMALALALDRLDTLDVRAQEYFAQFKKIGQLTRFGFVGQKLILRTALREPVPKHIKPVKGLGTVERAVAQEMRRAMNEASKRPPAGGGFQVNKAQELETLLGGTTRRVREERARGGRGPSGQFQGGIA